MNAFSSALMEIKNNSRIVNPEPTQEEIRNEMRTLRTFFGKTWRMVF